MLFKLQGHILSDSIYADLGACVCPNYVRGNFSVGRPTAAMYTFLRQ